MNYIQLFLYLFLWGLGEDVTGEGKGLDTQIKGQQYLCI